MYGSTGLMDMYLGTLDRDDLEKLGGLDRFKNSNLGIGWVKSLFASDIHSRWHPGTDMATCIDGPQGQHGIRGSTSRI